MRYPYLLIIAVAALVILPGYSSAYCSSVSVTGSTGSDYFTVELSSNTAILNGSISYTEDSVKTIQADTYTLISGANLLITGTGAYSISYDASFYDNGVEMNGITTYLFVGSDSVIDEHTVLYPSISYEVQFSAAFPAVQFTGPITCDLSIMISAIVNTSTFDLDGNCATIKIEDDPISELVDVTPGEGADGNYTKTTVTESGCQQVIVSNNTNASGGVADSEGNIDIVLDIPENVAFCIKIWNREGYDVYANITFSNIIINGSSGSHTYTNQKLGAGYARYFCHYTTSGTFGSEYWSTTNLNNVKNNNGWFYSSSGTVTITIDGHYDDGEGNLAQNVRLSVVFRDAI